MLCARVVRENGTLYSAYRTEVNIKNCPGILFSFSFELERKKGKSGYMGYLKYTV